MIERFWQITCDVCGETDNSPVSGMTATEYRKDLIWWKQVDLRVIAKVLTLLFPRRDGKESLGVGDLCPACHEELKKAQKESKKA